MDVNLWGPPFWFILHTITLNYPDVPTYLEKRHHFDFFNNLQYILPCGTCREHYRKHFKEHPIDSYLDSKKTLVEWCVLMHNEVNKVTKKPEIETEELVQEYMDIFGSKDDVSIKQKRAAEFIFTKINMEDKKSNNHWIYIFSLTLLLIGGGYGYYLYVKS